MAAPPPAPPPTTVVYSRLSDIAQQVLATIHMLWNFQTPAHQNPSSPPVFPGRWEPYTRRKILGAGGEGLVHMWARIDQNHNITDRVVVKQCIPGQAGFNNARSWLLHPAWMIEPREHHMANAVETELAFMGADKHIAKCLGWGDRIGAPHFRFKLYYEYCPHGDLADVTDCQRQGRKEGRGANRRKINPEPYSEAFLWYMFESLALTAVAMDQADVVHTDLQAGNLLFGNRDPNHFNVFPTPKIHDFGSAHDLNDPNVVNRTALLNDPRCTPYLPPELLKRWVQDPVTGNWHGTNNWEQAGLTVSTKTNIWQVGMLMLSAMRLETPILEADYHHSDNWNMPINERLLFTVPGQQWPRFWVHQFAPLIRASNYSDRLVNLVKLCMNPNPNIRPTPQLLLSTVRRCMPGRVGGLDTHILTSPTTRKRGKLIIDLSDDFRVGKRFRRR